MIGLLLSVLVSSGVLVQGAVDKTCTKEMICQKGYTATVRPRVSYTNNLKREQLAVAQIPVETQMSSYEEDHFIPLELCGCPTCPENLWPQPWPEARQKDKLETKLHRDVCAGRISLEDAQAKIRSTFHIH